MLLVHPTKPVTQPQITVKRQDGETVLESEAWCYTFDELWIINLGKRFSVVESKLGD